MNDEQAAFVEEMGRFLGSLGMTPMAGRVWGYLLICEPAEQTAGDLARELHASRGAISGTARLLETAGFIRRTTRRGDRREYFSAPPTAFMTLVSNAGTIYGRLRTIAEQGLAALADRPPPVRERLQEAHELFVFVERELPIVLERFVEERRRARALQTG